MYSGIQIKAPSNVCFINHLKSRILFVYVTHAHVLMSMLVALYIANSKICNLRKICMQVKTLPKLMLYGKYGTQRVSRQNIALGQRVISRQNIALSFASYYICLSLTLLHAIFSIQHYR